MPVYAYSNAAKLAALNQRRAKKFHQGVVKALVDTSNSSVVTAHSQSSGIETPYTLKLANHPYSKLRPNDAYNPQMINAQTWRFFLTWHTVAVFSGSVASVTLINDSPEAKWMKGTKRMRQRLVLLPIRRKEVPKFQRRMRSAQQNALKLR